MRKGDCEVILPIPIEGTDVVGICIPEATGQSCGDDVESEEKRVCARADVLKTMILDGANPDHVKRFVNYASKWFDPAVNEVTSRNLMLRLQEVGIPLALLTLRLRADTAPLGTHLN
jgi:hypothetical protein